MAAAEFVEHDKWGDIVGVKESKLARAIQAGNTQLLSQKIRENHLFQLCIAFEHFSTAFALVASGVPAAGWMLKTCGRLRRPRVFTWMS